MTIEAQLEVLISLNNQQVKLLESLASKFDHIGEAVSDQPDVKEVVEEVVKEVKQQVEEKTPLEEVAKNSTSKRKRRTKAEMEADKKAEEKVEEKVEEEVEEVEDAPAPPDPKEVKGVQAFKKELIAIGRSSGQAGYVDTLRGILKEAGFAKAEDVTPDSFDSVLQAANEAFEEI